MYSHCTTRLYKAAGAASWPDSPAPSAQQQQNQQITQYKMPELKAEEIVQVDINPFLVIHTEICISKLA